MHEDPSASGQRLRESPVEISRRLRRDARAGLEAAQRSLEATHDSYGSILNRRLEPDRRRGPVDAPESDGAAGAALVQDLVPGFLDTEPQVHWLPDTPHAPPDREA